MTETLPTDLIKQADAATTIFRVKEQTLSSAICRGMYPGLKRYKLGRFVYMSEAQAKEVCAQVNRMKTV